MADPFMGDFATNYGEDGASRGSCCWEPPCLVLTSSSSPPPPLEFEYGVLPDEMDLEPEQFRAMPADALAGRRSSAPGTQLDEFDAMPMPMPQDDEDEFAPLPDEDDPAMLPGGAARGASLAGSLDLDGPGAFLPGDSPGAAPREAGAATPGAGGAPRGTGVGADGAGPSAQPVGGAAAQRAGGGDDGDRGARKRKFKLDSAVVLTNAQIRNALKDTSDITRPRGGAAFGAGLPAALAAADAGTPADGVDALVEAPAIVALGAAVKLRRLFFVPTNAAMMANATAAAAAAVAAATQRAQNLAGQHAEGDEAGPATAPVGPAFDDDDAMPAPMADDDLGFFPAPMGGFDDDAFVGGAHQAAGDGHASPHQGSAPSRSIRRLSSALDVADEDGAAVPSGPAGDAAGEGAAAAPEAAAAHQHWSKRTRHVLGFLQRSFAALEAEQQGGAEAGTQEREPVTPGGRAAPGPVLQLEPLLQGQSKTHAARLFFELLVLSKDGFVALEQSSPYADVRIAPAAGLTAAAQ